MLVKNKSDEANIEKLLNKLGNTTDRRAQFVLCHKYEWP